jgi:Sep-tRNA:Cys-tRNA synthetase
MGSNLIAMMASFPEVQKRTQNWDDEVKKSNYFIDALLTIEGAKYCQSTRENMPFQR